MNKQVVLIVEDELAIRKLLSIALENDGFQVVQSTTGQEGISLAASHQPAVVLLDLGLPDQPGLMVLRELRIWFTRGIIIISVRDDEASVIEALDHGADDYLIKPFRTGELLARIRNVLRRKRDEITQAVIHIRDLTINIEKHTVTRNGASIRLTGMEFKLLVLLASNPGKLLTHAFILKAIWGNSFSSETQYLRVYVSQLRKKIETPGDSPFIHTESGIGYRFVTD